MNEHLQTVLNLHDVEEIELGLYRCPSQELGLRSVFGGQVMGQSLACAKETVDENRTLHSFHAYFLLPGDEQLPIVYRVQTLRDGRSYSARRIEAIQKGRPIFYMTCSFQQAETGLEYQISMPEVPNPEDVPSLAELSKPWSKKMNRPLYLFFREDSAFDIRPVNPDNPFEPKKNTEIQHVWLKVREGLPDNLRMHQYLLAYISDFNFLIAATRPHGLSYFDPKLRLATIDHAMWFHRPIKIDEWILFSVECTNTCHGRAFVEGKFFNQQGQLLAQANQEGVMRIKQD